MTKEKNNLQTMVENSKIEETKSKRQKRYYVAGASGVGISMKPPDVFVRRSQPIPIPTPINNNEELIEWPPDRN
jgi:hypothetical protein